MGSDDVERSRFCALKLREDEEVPRCVRNDGRRGGGPVDREAIAGDNSPSAQMSMGAPITEEGE
jgi:hypothetical protein